jgi:hypothetical protein
MRQPVISVTLQVVTQPPVYILKEVVSSQIYGRLYSSSSLPMRGYQKAKKQAVAEEDSAKLPK